MKRVVLFIVLALISISVYAADNVFRGRISLQTGFLTGEGFLKLSQKEKVSYAMGIVDGFLSAPMFGANAKYVDWLSECAKGKTNTQVSAILTKYLQDNPGRWDKSVQILMFEALLAECEK